MVGDATMETKACRQLNNANDTILLNNVMKTGDLFLSTASCYIFYLNVRSLRIKCNDFIENI
jgi:hypothetical protein